MSARPPSRLWKRVRLGLGLLLLAAGNLYVLVFIPLPYFIFQPGTAEEVGAMVHGAMEESGDAGENGSKGGFWLTTVGAYRANMLQMLAAGFYDYDVIHESDLLERGESLHDYSLRQHAVMLSSQANAIQAAYGVAGLDYRVEPSGVMVLEIAAGSPADGRLQPGDLILSVDGTGVRQVSELVGLLDGKPPGGTVKVEIEREQETFAVELALQASSDSPHRDGEVSGIGVVAGELMEVVPADPRWQITVDAGDIGGPSAGLMFALEIVDRLTNGDLTRGYRIAGTGTIDANGQVGPIGGIRHKVVAAHRAGTDIFFAPKDSEMDGRAIRNATEAMFKARSIGSSMTIVPVSSLGEAIDYLESLPPKQG